MNHPVSIRPAPSLFRVFFILLVLGGLCSPVTAQGSSARLRKLREAMEARRAAEALNLPDDPAPTPSTDLTGPGTDLSGSGTNLNGPSSGLPDSLRPIGVPPAAPPMFDSSAGDLNLGTLPLTKRRSVQTRAMSTADRATMNKAANAAKVDVAKVEKGGFKLLKASTPLNLDYGLAPGEAAEYVLEIQAKLRLPSSKAPVPFHQLLIVRVKKALRGQEVEWEYKVVDAKKSQLVTQKDAVKEVLVEDTDTKGALALLATDRFGSDVEGGGDLAQDQVLEWLRLALPDHPVRLGYGWRNLDPEEVGSRREAKDSLYLLHKVATLGDTKVAVLRGRIRSLGAEQGTTQFKSKGQDRVLFDVTRGRVLYREFRVEGAYMRRTPQGPKPFQARYKGLIMERSLLKDLGSVAEKSARLNAATALFGG